MTTQSPEVTHITLKSVIAWIFGSVVGLVGIIVIFTYPIFGVCLLVSAAIVFPPSSQFLKNNWHFSLSTSLKIVIIVVLMIIGGVTLPSQTAPSTNPPVATIPTDTQAQPVSMQAPTPVSQTPTKNTTHQPIPAPAHTVAAPVQSAPTPTPQPVVAATPPPPLQPQPINLSGSTQEASQQFNLQAGLSLFTLSYTGTGNFSVWLVDQNGNNVALLANVVGDFNGSIAEGIQTAGPYLLNVQADGPWSVNITQPRPTTAPSTRSFTGSTQEATALFYLPSGLHVFNMNYTGADNFSVWLEDQDGNNVDLLANTIGSFNGSKAEGVDTSGLYLLNVQGSGSWTITTQ